MIGSLLERGHAGCIGRGRPGLEHTALAARRLADPGAGPPRAAGTFGRSVRAPASRRRAARTALTLDFPDACDCSRVMCADLFAAPSRERKCVRRRPIGRHPWRAFRARRRRRRGRDPNSDYARAAAAPSTKRSRCPVRDSCVPIAFLPRRIVPIGMITPRVGHRRATDGARNDRVTPADGSSRVSVDLEDDDNVEIGLAFMRSASAAGATRRPRRRPPRSRAGRRPVAARWPDRRRA